MIQNRQSFGAAIAVAILLASLVTSCDPQPALPALPALPTTAQLAVADNWLLTECTGTEGDSITDTLRAIGSPLEAKFLDAFRNGMPASIRLHIDTSARLIYQMVRSQIDSTDTVAYPPGNSFLTSSDSTFARDETDSFTFGYRTRALAGLGVISTKRSIALLDSVAGDTTSPFFATATSIRAEMSPPNVYRIR